jgi:hypothetical protein
MNATFVSSSSVEILMTCAEIAVALVGFSGIIVALGFHAGASISPAFRHRTVLLIVSGAGTMLLALLPVVLGQFGIQQHSIWPACSAVMTVYNVLFVVGAIPGARRSDPGYGNAVLRFGVMPLVFLNAAVQTANTFGAFDASFGIYLAGIVWHLFANAIMLLYFLVLPAR